MVDPIFCVAFTFEGPDGVHQSVFAFERREDAEVLRRNFEETFAAGRPERLIALTLEELLVTPAIEDDE